MSINLLAWREQHLKRRLIKHLIVLSITWILISFSVMMIRDYLMNIKGKYEMTHLHLTEQIQSVNANESLAALSAQYQLILQQLELFKLIHRQNAHFLQAMALLEKKLPGSIELEQLSWRHDLLQLQGICFVNEQIHALLKIMEKSLILTKVNLINIQHMDASAAAKFTVRAEPNLADKSRNDAGARSDS